MDASQRSLELTSRKLRMDDLPTMQKDRIKLMHGSLTYGDTRLAGHDTATVVEVIERASGGRD